MSERNSQIVDHRQLVSIGVVDKPLLEKIVRDLWGVDKEQTVSYNSGIHQVTLNEGLGTNGHIDEVGTDHICWPTRCKSQPHFSREDRADSR